MATIEALYKLQELELAIKKNKADLADIAARIERDDAAVHAHALAVRAQRRRGWTARCRIPSSG